jgi:threonine synthase
MNGHFHCSSCNADHGSRIDFHQCPQCSSPLSFTLDPPATFPRSHIETRPPGMWRYAEALPVFPSPVSLGESSTPLVPFQCGDFQGLAKCEYALPSGSYKDRGSALLMSYLLENGVPEAVEDSSGNAGASLAAYAARADIRLKVFCPASASAGKLLQIRLYNAELVRVEGPRPRATEALLEYVEKTGASYASHLWHPLFIEGVKTAAFEIVEQLAWTAPDAVLCPVGAGSILLGLHRGFAELLAAGSIDRLPRLVAVQAQNVSPVHAAYRAGAATVAPAIDAPPTRAEGIALPGPIRDREVLQAIAASSGSVIAVTEEEIADGVRQFGRAGFCVEPTSAVVWHGLRRFREEASLASNARVVTILSGHGLKATQAIGEML